MCVCGGGGQCMQVWWGRWGRERMGGDGGLAFSNKFSSLLLLLFSVLLPTNKNIYLTLKSIKW